MKGLILFLMLVSSVAFARVDRSENYLYNNSEHMVLQPSASVPQVVKVQITDANSLGGEYFEISKPTTTYYVWFNETGNKKSIDPLLTGKTAIPVVITSSMTVAQRATALGNALTSAGFTVSVSSPNVTVTNTASGYALPPLWDTFHGGITLYTAGADASLVLSNNINLYGGYVFCSLFSRAGPNGASGTNTITLQVSPYDTTDGWISTAQTITTTTTADSMAYGAPVRVAGKRVRVITNGFPTSGLENITLLCTSN